MVVWRRCQSEISSGFRPLSAALCSLTEVSVLDLTLACAHHLLIFTVFATLLAEFLMLRAALTVADVTRIARFDLAYGISALLILVIGFSRAIFAAKGWGYYSHSLFFWAKIGTFALIGILSIVPTVTFLRWRGSGVTPDEAAVRVVRRYLHWELGLFLLLPLFAAAMARGYGAF
jgi:putative membrane protein